MNRCIDRRLISLNKNLSKTFYQPLEPKNRIQRRLIFSDDRCIAKRSMSFFAKLCEIFHCHLRFFSNDLLYTNTNAQEINLSPTKMCTKRLISCSNIFCTKDRSRSKQFGQWREWSLDGLKIAFPSLIVLALVKISWKNQLNPTSFKTPPKAHQFYKGI